MDMPNRLVPKFDLNKFINSFCRGVKYDIVGFCYV